MRRSDLPAAPLLSGYPVDLEGGVSRKVPLPRRGGDWWEKGEAVGLLAISNGLNRGFVADAGGALHMSLQRGVHGKYVGSELEVWCWGC